uniref:CDK5RAP1-like protein n=1 Tax=Strongyloides papillosus TaxID=174720 RepID=A0A0N5BXQ3_STREA
MKRFINFNRYLSYSFRNTAKLKDGPGLNFFLADINNKRLPKIYPEISMTKEYLSADDLKGNGKKVHLITYGCQMNVNDMEIVRSILFKENDFSETKNINDAEIILLMTCSIREGAEEKVWKKLKYIKSISNKKKVVGVLGCMAERVKHNIMEKSRIVDLVAGPDSYRDLPRLLGITKYGQNAINVQLSFDETYADVQPVRENPDSKQAFVSIMRGCDNMCTYCVVPFTRGRERSRPIDSIIEEVKKLSDEGYKQITLLGQNVNSYRDVSESSIPVNSSTTPLSGFNTVYKNKEGGRRFDVLLDKISMIDPEMRIRFTSPHPKDFPLEVIELIKERKNICKQIHLPAQSGDNKTLFAMGRGYTVERYLELVNDIRERIPLIHLTSDFIAGFCGETEEGHKSTLDLIRNVKFSTCFVFPYSEREKTRAYYRLEDDVPEEVKVRRHQELKTTFRDTSLEWNKNLIASEQILLVESTKTKRSETAASGRTDGGIKTIFEMGNSKFNVGDYVKVKIISATSQTLQAIPLEKIKLVDC